MGAQPVHVQVGDTCSDPQHFDRMLSDRPFPVSPFSLQPLKTELCVFSDSTKAQRHVAVPMSFGLLITLRSAEKKALGQIDR